MKLNKILIFLVIAVIGIAIVVSLRNRREIEQIPEDDQISKLISEMTLQDKIGQMVLIDKTSISLDDVRRKSIGGVLSGGGGNPEADTPDQWYEMVKEFQTAALESKLKIPNSMELMPYMVMEILKVQLFFLIILA